MISYVPVLGQSDKITRPKTKFYSHIFYCTDRTLLVNINVLFQFHRKSRFRAICSATVLDKIAPECKFRLQFNSTPLNTSPDYTSSFNSCTQKLDYNKEKYKELNKHSALI